jgi:hypothetical protein
MLADNFVQKEFWKNEMNVVYISFNFVVVSSSKISCMLFIADEELYCWTMKMEAFLALIVDTKYRKFFGLPLVVHSILVSLFGVSLY